MPKAADRPTIVVVLRDGMVEQVMQNDAGNIREVCVIDFDPQASQRYYYRRIEKEAIEPSFGNKLLKAMMQDCSDKHLVRRLKSLTEKTKENT